MGTISIVFRVPIVNEFPDALGPFVAMRCSDSEPPSRWRKCGHLHKSNKMALRCAKRMSLGMASGENERVEVRSLHG